MEIRKFEIEDIDKIDLSCNDDILNTEDALMLMDYPSLTMLMDGVIVAIFGVVLCPNNVGAMWITPSKYVKKYRKTFVSIIKKYLEAFTSTFRLKKTITDCINSIERIRFVESLGFKYWNSDNNMRLYIKQ